MNDDQQNNKLFQAKQQLAQEIKILKIEILNDIEYLIKDLQVIRKELFDDLDLPSHPGINTCGINQNQHSLDIKTGELKAMVKLYRQM